MGEIAIFEKANLGSVRVVEQNGEPWFVAKDVAESLGYKWNGSSRIAHIPEEWRGVTSVVTPSGMQEMHILSEQGLYFFLGRSDKTRALPYQKWIAGDIVPALRRKGRYSITEKEERICLPPVESDFRQVFNIMSLALDKNQAFFCANTAVKCMHGVDVLQLAGNPALEAPSEAQDAFFTPTELGKEVGKSAVRLNRDFEDAGLQTKTSGVWEATEKGKPYSRRFDTGKKHDGGSPVTQLKWKKSVLGFVE